MGIAITGEFEPSDGAHGFDLYDAQDIKASNINAVLTVVSGGRVVASGTDGEIVVQTGAGVPSHSATEGTPYWDTSGNVLYVNNDGSTAWTAVAGASAPKAHAASHTDGSDDIQDATAAQKGVATAAQITKLDGIAVSANNYTHPNHSGDVTSVADGAQTIAAAAVTYAKMQNVSATDKILGRETAGAGIVEEIACTAAGRALLDDADAAAQLTTLGAASASDLTTHIADTTTHGTTGDVVGTSDTQTLTNKTITSPLVNELLDTNGNEAILLGATASAVNEVTITNAISGSAPEISATGVDPDINLSFAPKGLGASKFSRALDVEYEGTSRFSCKTCHASDYAKWRMTRARGTIASPTNVATGDIIGKFEGVTRYGGAWRYQVAILFSLDGAPGGSAAPAKIDFQTSASGAAVTRFSIAAAGNCRVASTNKLEFNSSTAYIFSPSSGNLHLYSSTSTKLLTTGSVSRIEVDPTGIGFFNATPVAQPTVTGVRNNPTGALADLLTDLATLGLIVDSSTAGTAYTNTIGVPFNALKAPGTKPATFVDHGISGAWEFSDATDDTIVFNLPVPLDMDITVAPTLKIGWSTNTAVDTETCVWQLEYLWTTEGEDTSAAAQETLTVNSNAIAQANGLIVAEITGIDVPSATDACIHCRLKRLGADANDDLTDTAELHGVCFTYTMEAGRN